MVQEEGEGSRSIRSEIADIKQMIIEGGGKKKKKDKEFKLPFGIRTGSKGKIKKGHWLAIVLKHNCQVDFKLLPSERDLVYLPDSQTYHLAIPHLAWRYKNYPTLILQEWDMNPLMPSKLYGDTVEDKRLASAQLAILNKFMSGQVKPKKSGLGGKGLMLLIVAIVVALYFISTLIKGG